MKRRSFLKLLGIAPALPYIDIRDNAQKIGPIKSSSYYKVIFPKRERMVTIGVNGQILHIQREAEVVIPGSYLIVAQDAPAIRGCNPKVLAESSKTEYEDAVETIP